MEIEASSRFLEREMGRLEKTPEGGVVRTD
jgi:hypothetical protein